MDRKSFFRGFGSGVIFASLILGISFMVRTSDPYVTSRAKELGMVYGTDSKLLAEKNTEDEEETPVPTGTEAPEKKKDAKVSEAPSAAVKTEASSAPTADAKASEAPTKSPADEAESIRKELEKEKEDIEREVKKEQKEQEQKKKLTIDVGDWSSDVSEKLEKLGIVKNAKEFDKYLNDNGYSASISAGTYNVSVKDTYAELAKKITGK